MLESSGEYPSSSISNQSVVQAPPGARRDELHLAGGLRLHLGVDPSGEIQDERHEQRHEHEQQHVRERGDEEAAEAHPASSAPANRNPTPRTVCR